MKVDHIINPEQDIEMLEKFFSIIGNAPAKVTVTPDNGKCSINWDADGWTVSIPTNARFFHVLHEAAHQIWSPFNLPEIIKKALADQETFLMADGIEDARISREVLAKFDKDIGRYQREVLQQAFNGFPESIMQLPIMAVAARAFHLHLDTLTDIQRKLLAYFGKEIDTAIAGSDPLASARVAIRIREWIKREQEQQQSLKPQPQQVPDLHNLISKAPQGKQEEHKEQEKSGQQESQGQNQPPPDEVEHEKQDDATDEKVESGKQDKTDQGGGLDTSTDVPAEEFDGEDDEFLEAVGAQLQQVVNQVANEAQEKGSGIRNQNEITALEPDGRHQAQEIETVQIPMEIPGKIRFKLNILPSREDEKRDIYGEPTPRVWEIRHGKMRVFQRRSRTQGQVIVMVDCSGSMGCDCKTHRTDRQYGKGVYSSRGFVAWVVANIISDRFHNTQVYAWNGTHSVVVAPVERGHRPVCREFGIDGIGTPTCSALLYMQSLLQREDRAVGILITDGEPENPHTSTMANRNHTKFIAQHLRDRGVRLGIVEIGPGLNLFPADVRVQVNNIDQIENIQPLLDYIQTYL